MISVIAVGYANSRRAVFQEVEPTRANESDLHDMPVWSLEEVDSSCTLRLVLPKDKCGRITAISCWSFWLVFESMTSQYS